MRTIWPWKRQGAIAAAAAEAEAAEKQGAQDGTVERRSRRERLVDEVYTCEEEAELAQMMSQINAEVLQELALQGISVSDLATLHSTDA